jgi:hypothetical protein
MLANLMFLSLSILSERVELKSNFTVEYAAVFVETGPS